MFKIEASNLVPVYDEIIFLSDSYTHYEIIYHFNVLY